MITVSILVFVIGVFIFSVSLAICSLLLSCLIYRHIIAHSSLLLLLLFSHAVVSDSAIPWTAARKAYFSLIISQSLLKLMSMVSVMLSNQLILCCPLLLLPSIFPIIKVLSSQIASGCQSFRVSTSLSVLPMNIKY